MATATAPTTETPQEIVTWMKKFGFDPRTMRTSANAAAKQEALEIARLLNDLRSHPDFQDYLQQFSEVAATWNWSNQWFEQYQSAARNPDVQAELRKKMHAVVAKLQALKKDLQAAPKTATVASIGEELSRQFGVVEINQSAIEQRVKADRPGDQLAAQALARRVAKVSSEVEQALEDGGTPEQEQRQEQHRRLALAGLGTIAKDQEQLLASFKKHKSQTRAHRAAQAEIAELVVAVESNIKFARQVPLRDDVLVKINECEATFKQAHGDAQQHLTALKTDMAQMQVIQADIERLQALVAESKALMSQPAVSLQAASQVPAAQVVCDSRFASGISALKNLEADLARVKKVNPSFDDKPIATRIQAARAELEQARSAAYGRFEKVIKTKGTDDVLTPLRKDFDAAQGDIAELRVDIDAALQDLDQVALKGHDLQAIVAQALKASEIIPGRKNLKEDFEKLLDKSNKLPESQKLFGLDEIQKRCEEISEEHERGEDEGGKDYWTKKKAALEAIEAEKAALEKARKSIGDRYEPAAAAIEEAELRFRRDDVAGFDQVAPFLKIAETIRTSKLAGPSLEFEKARIRVTPMIESGRLIIADLGTRFDTLLNDKAAAAKDAKKKPSVEQCLKDLASLYDEAAKAVRPAYRKWEQDLQKASPLAQFIGRLRDLPENEAAPRDQQEALKKRKLQGESLLAEYDEATLLGDRGDYPAATKKLSAFVAAATSLETALNQDAQKVLDSAAKPVDAQGNPLKNSAGQDLTWTGPTAKVKDQAYGFNTTRDAMRYTAGQEMTSDGTLIVSNELDDIAKFLDFKLKKFRELCNLGQDPLAIARKVFEPVPENFWPPAAVRVVAVFRAAEQEFEEERLRKEAKELGLNPDKAAEVDDIRKQIEDAKKQKLPPGGLQKINAQMLKEGGKVALEEGSEGAEMVGQMLGLAKFWTTTNNFGVDEIGSFKTTDEKGEFDASKPVGFAGEFIEMGAGVIKTGLSAKELFNAYREFKEEKEKRDFKARKEDDQVSPVKKKILEFERNRAIAHLLKDATETVLNALSAGGHIPGMNIAGDVLALALAAMEAGRYFAMLATSLSHQEGSQNDPDSVTYLALARQAEEEGIAGGRKCFECAMKILKLTGDVVQLCGHAAPAGFAINVTSQALERGGQVCFKVYDWHDAANQKKFIKRAQQKPPDYQAIAEVFSNTRKYARFCIAWGCVHGDAWARSWVTARGDLKDADLDNPQTTTAIIRQYINVTQEGMLGDTQEDDPETFGKSLPGKALKGMKKAAEVVGGAVADKVLDKINDRNREIKSQFFDYSVGDKGLTRASWDKNLAKAYNPGGLFKSSEVMALGKLFDQLAEAQKMLDDATDPPGTDKGDAAFRQVSEASQAALDALRNALAAYEPTANPKGQEVHQCMKLYLGDLLTEIGRQSTTLSQLRDKYWKSSFVAQAGGDEEQAKKLQQDALDKAEDKRRQQVADFDDLRSDEVEKRLKDVEFATIFGKFKIAEPAGRGQLQTAAVARLELKLPADAKEIQKLNRLIDATYDSVSHRLWMNLSGLKPEIADDGSMSLPQEFDAQFKLQQKTAEKAFAAALKVACEAAVADHVKAYTFNADKKRPTPTDRCRTYGEMGYNGPVMWTQDLVDASDGKQNGGWVRDGKADKVGKTLRAFALLQGTLWSQLSANEKSVQTQSEWRAALTRLRSSLKSFSCATKYGTDHPGMVDFRERFLASLDKLEKIMNHDMVRVNRMVDWIPDKSFFDGLAFDTPTYKHVVALCKTHLLDKKTIDPQAEALFKACSEPRTYWQTVKDNPDKFTKALATTLGTSYDTALKALKKSLDGMQPKYSAKHPRAGEPHDGMIAYLKSASSRIGDGSSGLTKEIADLLAKGKFKSA